MSLDELYAKAKQLAGRDIEVEQVQDGSYIALYMNINRSPPPKAPTVELALEGFINYMENTNGNSN